MDDRIRVSDADRDHVTARLRDHFAQGRLTPDELDERITAALNAKTVGDLRHVMADLPEPAAVAPRPQWTGPQWAGPPWAARRYHRPRVLPLVLLALFAALVIPSGGWFLFVFVRLFLLAWLVTFLAGTLFGVFHRRAHRYR
jgi:uncharacterized protein DUF1707